MRLYRSLVYRELKLTQKHNILMFICFILLAALMLTPALLTNYGSSAEDLSADEKSILTIAYIIITPAAGSFMACANNRIHKADISAGWRNYSIVLPVTAAQKALADLAVKLIFFVELGLIAVLYAVMLRALSYDLAIINAVNIYLIVGAVALVFDAIYCGVIMLSSNKSELKKYGIIAGAAGLVMLELISPPKLDRGSSEATIKEAFAKVGAFTGSVKVLAVTAAIFAAVCILYFIVMWRSHERREP